METEPITYVFTEHDVKVARLGQLNLLLEQTQKQIAAFSAERDRIITELAQEAKPKDENQPQ